MKNDALIRIYTRPLFELAVETKSIEGVANETETLAQLFDQVPLLEEYFDSPNISRSAKLDLLKKAYDRPWSKYFANFLTLVFKKGRQEILPHVWDAFRHYWDEYRSRIEVKVTTAVGLSPDQMKAIEKKLNQRTGKNVILDCKLDPELIGGLRLQIGHQLLDASVAGKLAALKEELLRI